MNSFTIAVLASMAFSVDAIWTNSNRSTQQDGYSSQSSYSHGHSNGNPYSQSQGYQSHSQNPYSYMPAAPKIVEVKQAKYAPDAELYIPVFATCEFTYGDFMMLQLPSGAIMAKATLAGLTPETEYQIRVFEFGDLSEVDGACSALGDEFNPFKQEAEEPQWTRWGWSTPAAVDETIGTLDSFTTDVDGQSDFMQQYFLQNLAGDNSLIGKSMAIFEKDDTETILDCCIIALDMHRVPETVPEEYVHIDD